MVNNLRSPEIIKLANQQSIVRVEELAEYFNVSLQTIRKDLNKLCSDGQLERVHGGAIIPSHIENIEYEQRKKINLLGKQAIGRECAKKIPNDICLFMGIGTSTETAAKLLLEHKNLLIVTNNLNIANVLKNNAKSEVVVTGGNLRKSDGALIGIEEPMKIHIDEIDHHYVMTPWLPFSNQKLHILENFNVMLTSDVNDDVKHHYMKIILDEIQTDKEMMEEQVKIMKGNATTH